MTIKNTKEHGILGSKLVLFESAEKIAGSKLRLIKNVFHKKVFSSRIIGSRLGIIKEIINRIKSDESIKGKLKKNKKNYTYENAVEICRDIVGFRIICMYEQDIYTIVDLIRNSGLKIVREKDYVINPKESGYRSYHMTIEVPIELPDETVENVLVEIQIRTDFMDLWAQREHGMKYRSKLTKEELSPISQALIDLSGAIHISQVAMENARKKQLEIIEDIEVNEIEVDENEEVFDSEIIQAAEDVVSYKLNMIKNIFETLPFSSNKEGSRLGDIKEILNREEINKFIDSTKNTLEYNSGIAEKTKKDNVGFRFICMYEQDIFTIVDLIRKSGLKIVEEKDYVTNPKESGYRSFHITVEVPVDLPDGTIENVRVKIQIRTDFMDLWASREYDMKYGSKLNNEALSTISQALIDLSGAIHISQVAMENARKKQLSIMELANTKKSEEVKVKKISLKK